MPTRVYKYGLRPPTGMVDVIRQQLRLACRYYNELIEIENLRRVSMYAVLAEHGCDIFEAEVARLVEEIDAAKEEVKKMRQQARTRLAAPDLWERLKALYEKKHIAKKVLKEKRVELKEDKVVQAKLDAVEAEAKVASIGARALSQLYWGNYLIVEQAVEAAKRTTLLNAPVKFRRWCGEGALAVQIQYGLPVAEIFANDTRVRIDPVPMTAWARRRSPEQRTILRLRIGSIERKPIFGIWPLILHRPIPQNAVVSWAKVILHKIGGKERWELHLTLNLPEADASCGTGAVAVDLGWRLREDGLRVGYAVGADGFEKEILVQNAIIQDMRKVDDLQSIRDANLDKLRPWLAKWLKGRVLPDWMQQWGKKEKRKEGELRPWLAMWLKGKEHTLPEWMQQWCKRKNGKEEKKESGISTLHAWKSQAKFAALAIAWRDNRWPGDEEVFEHFEAWRKQDKHLWTWQANLRDQVLHRRRDCYRAIAAELANRHKTLVLEKFDLLRMQRHKPTESEQPEIAAARLQQRRAAPYELRQCLVDAFAVRGGKVVYIEPAYTTQQCKKCGYIESWDATNLLHTCPKCGEKWDQDENAGSVLLQRFERLSAIGEAQNENDAESGAYTGGAGRWQRRKVSRSQNAAQNSGSVG